MVSTAAQSRIWLSKRRKKKEGAMDGSLEEQPGLGGGEFGLLSNWWRWLLGTHVLMDNNAPLDGLSTKVASLTWYSSYGV